MGTDLCTEIMEVKPKSEFVYAVNGVKVIRENIQAKAMWWVLR